MNSTTSAPPAVAGSLRVLLRVEALAVFAVALAAYARGDHGWGRLAALFLVPDVSLLVYLIGPRAGAAAYNTAHSYIGPLALLGVALALLPAAMPYALMWFAHCGLDRALGFGLKYPTAFADTHLGRIGRPKRAPAGAAAA